MNEEQRREWCEAVLAGLPEDHIEEALKFPCEWERLAKLRDGIQAHLTHLHARLGRAAGK